MRQARAAFWRARFGAAGELIKSATKHAHAARLLDVEAVIEHLIGPLFLRAFITGAPIDRAFIKTTARAAVHLAACAGSVAAETAI